MGGLHIAMNFMKCIGDHMRGSGLHELWMECELLGPVAAENVLGGKHYSRGSSNLEDFTARLCVICIYQKC